MGIAEVKRIVPHTSFLVRDTGRINDQMVRLPSEFQVLHVRTCALSSLSNIFLKSSALQVFYDRELTDCRSLTYGIGIIEQVSGRRYEYTKKETSSLVAAISAELKLTPDETVFASHLAEIVLPKNLIGEIFTGNNIEKETKDDISYYFNNFGIYNDLKSFLSVSTGTDNAVFVKKNRWTLEHADAKAVTVRNEILLGLRNKILFEPREPSSFIGRIYTNGKREKVMLCERTAFGYGEVDAGTRPLYERLNNDLLKDAVEKELGIKLSDDELIFLTSLCERFLPKGYSGQFTLNGQFMPLNNLLFPS